MVVVVAGWVVGGTVVGVVDVDVGGDVVAGDAVWTMVDATAGPLVVALLPPPPLLHAARVTAITPRVVRRFFIGTHRNSIPQGTAPHGWPSTNIPTDPSRPKR